MNTIDHTEGLRVRQGYKRPVYSLGAVLFVLLSSLMSLLLNTTQVSAACAAPATDFGRVSVTIPAPAAATYRLWTRMYVPDTTNDSYLLEVDGNQCFSVGGTGVSARNWVWVSHHDNSTSSRVDVQLAKGNHTLKLIGERPGVRIDRIIISSDLDCTPTGYGDNCKASADTTPPTAKITAPLSDAVVSGPAVQLTASAHDAVGVTRVEFYADGMLIFNDTSSPHSATWDSTKVANGTHQLSIRAFDNSGNMATDTVSIRTANGDTQAPTPPLKLTAEVKSPTKILLKWAASKDNTAVTGYVVYRNGVPIKEVGAITEFEDAGVLPKTSYSYRISAIDAAGNRSPKSAAVKAQTTPAAADSDPPSQPQGLAVIAVGLHQINLTWTASADNAMIAGYDVYRSSGKGKPKKISSTLSTNYGDATLKPGTAYSYYVVARDGRDNTSKQSNKLSATTQANAPESTAYRISGTVKSRNGAEGLGGVRMVVLVDGKHYMYQTNSAGVYRIRDVTSNKYEIAVKKQGYEPSTHTITVGKRDISRDVVLVTAKKEAGR